MGKDRAFKAVTFKFSLLVVLTLGTFLLCLFNGSVDISAPEVIKSLLGTSADEINSYVIFSSRLPMAITAALCGAALAVAGLLLQTALQNPLAGPSILGVSTGSGLGVAIAILGGGLMCQDYYSLNTDLLTFFGAIAGAILVIVILTFLSSLIKNTALLLIAGIMIGYLASSVISLLNFFAPASQLKLFTVWGLGSFADVPMTKIPLFASTVITCLIASIFLIKPLNALLLGDRYAASMGYNIKYTRTIILVLSGLLTAFATSYCGPIGFIGLTVPHISRMLFSTSNHTIILPATLIAGILVSLFCTYLSVGMIPTGIIPINAVTPIIGVPIVIYILLNRKHLKNFS